MSMDPMAANQGMFGGYGMGMNNGMNMGMNFDAGQGMYAGGWDGSQNNMWNGGQDKFNPNAFANGMGSQYGPSSGFGGFNMSQPNANYFPNQDFSNGYYGPGYGRGGFRGRGRGFFPGGRGRGGFMNANYLNAAFQNPNSPSFNQAVPAEVQDGEVPADASTDADKPEGEQGTSGQQDPEDPASKEMTDETMGEKVPGEEVPDASGSFAEDDSQPRGIPTIDSLDQTNAAMSGLVGMPGPHMGPGFGRGFMRGLFPGGRGGGFPGGPFVPGPMPGQGVEGAPAAPRAMREGLPNTSVLRQRYQGRASVPASRPSEGTQRWALHVRLFLCDNDTNVLKAEPQ